MSRVLVVDDEDRVGAALRFALAPHGYDVEQERDPAAALTLARTHPPDCILLDVDLGGEDGLAWCRRLKEDPGTAAIPVIVLSGLVDPDSTARGLDAGADDYVTKPFTTAELRARIEAQLRRRGS